MYTYQEIKKGDAYNKNFKLYIHSVTLFSKRNKMEAIYEILVYSFNIKTYRK